MGLKDWFGKKRSEPAPDPLADLSLARMKKGFMVDYDLKTWQVEAVNIYDWGGGEKTTEWQLRSHDDTIYLELDADDEEEWSVSRPIRFSQLGREIRSQIRNAGNPPDEIVFEDTRYYLEESSDGRYFKDGKGPSDEFTQWEYWDDSEDKFLCIEQWDDNEFEASAGFSVEEYHFSNILPTHSEPT
jgi:hypothetical protein